MTDPFWERPEIVDRFAAREPDHRVAAWAAANWGSGRLRVLDIGCAGGRNTVHLAALGFDVHGLDSSPAMVARTRERLAALPPRGDAAERVHLGRMDDLSAFPDGRFDLVIALGVYHMAKTMVEWERSIGETARVLRVGGELLVNHFTPEVALEGEPARPLPDAPGVHEGLPSGRGVLMHADALDAALHRFGLDPVVPSETVRVETLKGRRVSVNGHYRKRAGDGAAQPPTTETA